MIRRWTSGAARRHRQPRAAAGARGPAGPPDVAGRGPGHREPRPRCCRRASTSTRTPRCSRWPAGATRSQQSIADTIDVSRTTMVKVAAALADQGLVERVRNPDDRRSYLLTRTPEGAARRPALATPRRGPRGGADAGLLARRARGAARAAARDPREELAPDTPEPLLESLGFLITRVHLRMHRAFSEALAPLRHRARALRAARPRWRRSGRCRRPRSAGGWASAEPAWCRWSTTSRTRGLVERRRLEWDRRTQVLHLQPGAAEVLARRGRWPRRRWPPAGHLGVREIKRLVLLLQRFVTGDEACRRRSSIRQSGLTRPGGSTSSSDSSATPSPATASISARVSVQGGSAVTGSSSRRTIWTTSAVPPAPSVRGRRRPRGSRSDGCSACSV